MLIKEARAWPPGGGQAPGQAPEQAAGQASGQAAEQAWARIPRTDVRLAGGQITACGPGLRPAPGEDVIEADGGLLLPGLHDHHVHLRALAAAAASVAAGPPDTRTAAELAARLRAADAELPQGAWLRAVGYHESVAGPLDRDALDRLVPHRPVRVQHRTGALWMVNSPGAALLGLDGCDLDGVERDGFGRPTGRLWRLDRWLAARMPGPSQDGASQKGASQKGASQDTTGLGAVSQAAASLGVTGFTDATPGATAADLAALAAAPVAQRLLCMAPAGVDPPADAGPGAGGSGAGGPGAGGRGAGGPVTAGPEKVLLDDDTLPALDALASRIGRAHAAGRAVAVHCVTRVQLVLTLAALDLAGRHPGDRIEHGAVIGAASMAGLRGLTVVTQPNFIAERGAQYAAEVPPEDWPDLWRLRSLITAGVTVAAGTDAPFGLADPWHAMRGATDRPPPFGTSEAVPAATAVALFLGQPAAPGVQRRVAAGQPGDLALLRAGPLEALRALSSDLVAVTLVGGEVCYRRG